MMIRFANLFAKAVTLMAVSLMFASGVNAVQNGDVVAEDVEVFFSETDRITVDDVEYLYTFKGVRPYQSIAVNVVEYPNGGYGYNTYIQYCGSVETQFVIEKAIPLTGNYNVTINVDHLLNAFGCTSGHTCAYYPFSTWDDTWGSSGYFQTNFYYNAASTIVIGDSCFEDNELVETVSIEHDGISRNLCIAKRSFYGAVNLREVCVWNPDLAGRLQLKSIGESAFEGCQNLIFLNCCCDELERIDDRAFSDCSYFEGVSSDLFYWEPVWYTPKLSHVGDYAFYNAGNGSNCRVKWTLGNKDLEIGEYAFSSCGCFGEIHFPSNMERIVENSFWGLNGWGLNALGEFYGSSVTRLYFPDSLASIGRSAFERSNVQVMHWPSALQEIGDLAFGDSSTMVNYYVNPEKTAVCSSLASEWTNGLPTTVVNLGAGVFSGACQFGGTWSEAVWSNGKITALRYSYNSLRSCGSLSGTISYPTNLTSVPSRSFSGNVFLERMVLHESVTNIGSYAFAGCSRLSLIVPASVREIGMNAGAPQTYYNGTAPGVKSVVFEGKPPKGIAKSGFLDCSKVLVPVEYASDWAPYLNPNVKLARKIDGEWTALGGSLVSAKIRDGVPNVMDITYKVTSIKPTAKVRLVAFKDGTRSFAKATIPVTLVNDAEGNPTAGNVGDAVVPNVEHVVSWQVSSDWGDVKLAKISVEIFVLDDELLPLQLMTLPANETRGKLTFSTNTQSTEKITNALYWLLASHESDLNLANGKLTRTDTGAVLANGTSVNTANALAYLYGKMGYGVLSGGNLTEVNSTVRLSLGADAYAVKVEAE